MDHKKFKDQESKEDYLARESYSECFSMRVSPTMRETILHLSKEGYEINQPVRDFLGEYLIKLLGHFKKKQDESNND